jgi:hypothetical protein
MFKNYIEIDEMQEKFADPKEVIRFRKSKKNRQHNGQKIPRDDFHFPFSIPEHTRFLVGFVLLDL